MIILIQVMNNFFKSIKNIILLVLLITTIILFCVFSRNIYFNIAIILIGISALYLLLFQHNYQVASMVTILGIVFVFINFYQSSILFMLLVGLVTIGLTYFYNLNNIDKKINLLYSCVLGIVICQLLFIFAAFAFSAIATALFTLLVYYLFLGLVKLNIENDLKISSMARYGLVFIVCAVILIINNQYF